MRISIARASSLIVLGLILPGLAAAQVSTATGSGAISSSSSPHVNLWLVNLFLLALAVLAVFIGVLGNTFDAAIKPWFKGIKALGWAAIAVGFAAFLGGVLKEYLQAGIDTHRETLQAEKEDRIRQENKRLHASIDEIRGNLSTEYIGKFPDTNPEILAILKRAKQEILIATDYFTYSSLSRYDDYIRIVQLLERKSRTLKPGKIRIVVLDEPSQTTRVVRQDADFDPSALEKDGKLQRYKDFYRNFGVTKEPHNVQELAEMFWQVEKAEQLKRWPQAAKCSLRESKSDFPIFLWIVDGSTAVFSIPNLSGEAEETAFKTKDPQLVRQLSNVWNEYWQNAKAPQHFPACSGGLPGNR